MIVNDFDIKNIFIDKTKADTPLVIDPDTPLADPVSVQCFESIGRRKPQVFDVCGKLKLIQAQDGTTQSDY